MNSRTLTRPLWTNSLTWFLCFGLFAACLLAWGDLAEDVWNRESFAWDAPVALAIHQLQQPWIDHVMQAMGQIGEIGAVSVAGVGMLWFWWRRHRHTAIALFISLGGALTLNTIFKFLFARARPHLFPPLMLETDYSFPSGQVIAAVAVYGFLAVLLWRSRHYGWAGFAGLLVGAAAVSRIYLGVHYPSDVLGSLTLGTLWLFTLFIVYGWYEDTTDWSNERIVQVRQQAIEYGIPPESIERVLAEEQPELKLSVK